MNQETGIMTTHWMTRVSGALAVLLLGLTGGLNAAEGAATLTLDNLQAAFQGESNAKVRYEAFAVKADEEGYKAVAALFRATSKSEGIHAARHAVAIKKLGAEAKATIEKPEVKSTKENLEAAVKGETAEKDTMYPAFVKQAELDKNTGAVQSFKGAMASEVSHAKLYQLALTELGSWKVAKDFLVCQICGYTTLDKELQKCPVCASPRTKFETVK
jgi:rubrerythrin